MWILIKETLKNPVVLVLILVLGLGLGLQYFMGQNALKNKDIQMYQQREQAYEQVFQAQQQTISILQNDVLRIDDLNKSKQTVIIRQQDLDRQLNEIPDTSEDRPFSNPDLLAAAGIMRNYQQSSPATTNTTSSNN